MILANQMAAYLVGSSDQQLNYLAGQTAVLRLDAAAQRRGYMLSTPGKLSFSIPADLNRRELPITRDRSGGQLPAPGGRQRRGGPRLQRQLRRRTRRSSTG